MHGRAPSMASFAASPEQNPGTQLVGAVVPWASTKLSRYARRCLHPPRREDGGDRVASVARITRRVGVCVGTQIAGEVDAMDGTVLTCVGGKFALPAEGSVGVPRLDVDRRLPIRSS